MAGKTVLTIDDQIRAAHKARKRKITLPVGANNRMVELTIERMDRRVHYTTNAGPVNTVEKWLRVKPADGSLVPVMQIELTLGCNMRSNIS